MRSGIEQPKQKEEKMKIDTKIRGWNFLKREYPEKHFALDGSGSLESLQDELNKLESRLAEIPGLITKKQNVIAQKKQDATYLLGLGWIKRRKWEKQNGKTVEGAAKELTGQADALQAEIESLKVENERLPERIETLKKQIETLVDAEGKGMEKGIDSESARQLGEMEVAKQREALAQQQMMMQKQMIAQETENSDDKKSSSTIWIVVAAGGLIILVSAILLIKRFKTRKTAVA